MLQRIVQYTLRRSIKNLLISVGNVYKTNQPSLWFHSSYRLNVKLFVDKENKYAHNILEKLSTYKLFNESGVNQHQVAAGPFTEKEIEDVINLKNPMSTDELLQSFKKLTLYCKNTNTQITEEKFDKFVDLFIMRCEEFDDGQLLECLKYFYFLPETPGGTRVRNFLELWATLDDVCCDRIDNWDVDRILLVCDHWFGINLAKTCEFVWQSLKKIGRKVRKLNPQQLVHTIFFCNIVRKPLVEMIDFEMNFKECIGKLSLNEIGIMSMGFFKTKTPIRSSEIIDEIYKRLMLQLNVVDDITLVNILKVLRYSTKIQQCEIIKELLDLICPEIERISLLSCLHVALMGSDFQQCHAKSLGLIVERFNNEINSARIKDMERISFVLSLYDFHTDKGVEQELCKKILISLKDRVEEVVQYPKCFSNCLHYLSICGHYNEELLSSALSEKFMKHAYRGNIFQARELFCLDSYARLNLKGKYCGNLLSEKKRKTMGKMLTDYIPERNSQYRLNVTDKILLEIKETCENMYGICHLKHVLPHFQRADIVINWNKSNGNSLPLSPHCPGDYTGVILSRDLLLEKDTSDTETIVIVVGGWNNYVRDIEKPTGLFKMKLQQLELLGHKVVTIPWFEWRQLETKSDRQNYIKRKLSTFMYSNHNRRQVKN